MSAGQHPPSGDGEQTEDGDLLHGNLLPWWRAGRGVAATIVPSSCVQADDLQHCPQVPGAQYCSPAAINSINILPDAGQQRVRSES